MSSNSISVKCYVVVVALAALLLCSPASAQFSYTVVARVGDPDSRTGGVIGDISFRDMSVPTISPDGQTIAFYSYLTLPSSQIVHGVFRSQLPGVLTSSVTNAGGPVPAWPTTPVLAPVARKGDSAPGWPGAHFGDPSTSAHFVPQMHVAVNMSRFLVFEAFAASQSNYGYGIWVRNPNGQVSCVARPGMVIPLPTSGGGSEDWTVVETQMFNGINVPTSPDVVFAHGCNGLDGTGSPLSDTGKLTFWAVLSRNDVQMELIFVVDVTRGQCVADVDDGTATGTPDGGVTIDDLLYYLSLFEAGDVRADVDDGAFTGTPDGGVTIDDLLYFLLRFEAGC